MCSLKNYAREVILDQLSTAIVNCQCEMYVKACTPIQNCSLQIYAIEEILDQDSNLDCVTDPRWIVGLRKAASVSGKPLLTQRLLAELPRQAELPPNGGNFAKPMQPCEATLQHI